MEPIRDKFSRTVPLNLYVLFRDRPVAVCPMCEGQAIRKDGKAMVLCGPCKGKGFLTDEDIAKLTPAQFDICRCYSESTPPLIPPPSSPVPAKRRKTEPEPVSL